MPHYLFPLVAPNNVEREAQTLPGDPLPLGCKENCTFPLIPGVGVGVALRETQTTTKALAPVVTWGPLIRSLITGPDNTAPPPTSQQWPIPSVSAQCMETLGCIPFWRLIHCIWNYTLSVPSVSKLWSPCANITFNLQETLNQRAGFTPHPRWEN